jgi:ABC-type dipeptide/oligopeptide/nickel transport system ATPase component
VALVGESGSGKSVASLAIMGLLCRHHGHRSGQAERR